MPELAALESKSITVLEKTAAALFVGASDVVRASAATEEDAEQLLSSADDAPGPYDPPPPRESNPVTRKRKKILTLMAVMVHEWCRQGLAAPRAVTCAAESWLFLSQLYTSQLRSCLKAQQPGRKGAVSADNLPVEIVLGHYGAATIDSIGPRWDRTLYQWLLAQPDLSVASAPPSTEFVFCFLLCMTQYCQVSSLCVEADLDDAYVQLVEMTREAVAADRIASSASIAALFGACLFSTVAKHVFLHTVSDIVLACFVDADPQILSMLESNESSEIVLATIAVEATYPKLFTRPFFHDWLS